MECRSVVGLPIQPDMDQEETHRNFALTTRPLLRMVCVHLLHKAGRTGRK